MSSIDTTLRKSGPDRHWATLFLMEENQLNIGKGEPKKPRGNVFICILHENLPGGTQKKPLDASVNFSGSLRSAERDRDHVYWRKAKNEETAKADKVY